MDRRSRLLPMTPRVAVGGCPTGLVPLPALHQKISQVYISAAVAEPLGFILIFLPQPHRHLT